MYKAQNFYREQSFVSCKPAAGHVQTHHTNLGLYSRSRRIDKLEEYSVLVSGGHCLRDERIQKMDKKFLHCPLQLSTVPPLGFLMQIWFIKNGRLGRPSTQQVKFEITQLLWELVHKWNILERVSTLFFKINSRTNSHPLPSVIFLNLFQYSLEYSPIFPGACSDLS